MWLVSADAGPLRGVSIGRPKLATLVALSELGRCPSRTTWDLSRTRFLAILPIFSHFEIINFYFLFFSYSILLNYYAI